MGGAPGPGGSTSSPRARTSSSPRPPPPSREPPPTTSGCSSPSPAPSEVPSSTGDRAEPSLGRPSPCRETTGTSEAPSDLTSVVSPSDVVSPAASGSLPCTRVAKNSTSSDRSPASSPSYTPPTLLPSPPHLLQPLSTPHPSSCC